MGERLVVPSQVAQNQAQVAEGIGLVRLQLEGLAVAVDGLSGFSRKTQGLAADVVVLAAPAGDGDRLVDALEGGCVTAGLQLGHGEQVQELRMRRPRPSRGQQQGASLIGLARLEGGEGLVDAWRWRPLAGHDQATTRPVSSR